MFRVPWDEELFLRPGGQTPMQQGYAAATPARGPTLTELEELQAYREGRMPPGRPAVNATPPGWINVTPEDRGRMRAGTSFPGAAQFARPARPPPVRPNRTEPGEEQHLDDEEEEEEEEPSGLDTISTGQAHTDKDSEIRLTFRDIPEDVDEYLRWRLMAKAEIVKAVKRASKGRKWVGQVDLPGARPDHFHVMPGDPYEQLEHAIYTALLEAMKGGMAVKLHEELSSDEVVFGHGRQALLCLDKAVYVSKYELSMLANSELATMQQNPVSGTKQLDDSPTRSEILRKRATKDEADLMMTLRGMTKNVPDARSIVSPWMMLPPSSHDPRRIVQDLRRVVHDDKMDGLMSATRTSRKEKAAAARLEKKEKAALVAAEKDKGRGRQEKADKKGNRRSTSVPGNTAAAAGGDRGRSTSKGKGGKGRGKGASAPRFDGDYNHCGKGGHRKADCIW